MNNLSSYCGLTDSRMTQIYLYFFNTNFPHKISELPTALYRWAGFFGSLRAFNCPKVDICANREVKFLSFERKIQSKILEKKGGKLKQCI